MKSKKRILNLTAAVFGASVTLAAGPVLAEDAFEGWGSVTARELAEERGMAVDTDESALAKAIGAQNQTVTINGDVVGDAAKIHFGTHTFDGQVMSLNIINSGHNNVFQAQNVIAVTVNNSTVNP